jgi:hypothetical protein
MDSNALDVIINGTLHKKGSQMSVQDARAPIGTDQGKENTLNESMICQKPK